MATEILSRGGNPHMLLTNLQGVSFPTTFCPGASSDVGMAMLRRVHEWKLTVIKSMDPEGKYNFPMDTLISIFALAGVGEVGMACAKAPWIPSMPVRSTAAPWVGYYTGIDLFWARRAAAAQGGGADTADAAMVGAGEGV
jgi:hypothetical protein